MGEWLWFRTLDLEVRDPSSRFLANKQVAYTLFTKLYKMCYQPVLWLVGGETMQHDRLQHTDYYFFNFQFSSMTSANVRNNITTYNTVKHVRSINAEK